MDMHVVMYVDRAVCQSVLAEMRAAGLDALPFTDPTRPSRYDPANFAGRSAREGGSRVVYIAVPPDQRSAAEHFAVQWLAKQKAVSRKISAETARMALFALAAAVAAAAVMFVVGWQPLTIVYAAVFVFTVAFIYAIALTHRRTDARATSVPLARSMDAGAADGRSTP